MCLYIKNPVKPQIANKDILVFKVLLEEANKTVKSYFYLKKYEKDILYTSEIKIFLFSVELYSIETALHSYSIDCFCEVGEGRYLRVGKDDNHQIYSSDSVVGLFKIPKGSEYYLCNGCYASNQIVYLGEYYYLSTWMKVRERLKEKIKNYVSSIK